MNAPALFALFAAIASLALYRMIYDRLKAGFFFYLLAASLFMACSCGALCLGSSPPAAALADMSVALCGGFLAAAAVSLSGSFRLAGGHDD